MKQKIKTISATTRIYLIRIVNFNLYTLKSVSKLKKINQCNTKQPHQCMTYESKIQDKCGTVL